MIKLMLVDDHDLFRSGLKAILQRNQELEVIAEADSGEAALEVLKSVFPDVLLLDITLPGTSGLDLIQEVKKLAPEVKIILLTMHEEGQYIVKGIKQGASAYLLKNSDEDELVKAIKTVFSGSKFYNAKVSELMVQNLSANDGEEINLTQREKEVLHYVLEGYSTKMMAAEMHISARTAETHRLNIMKKLGAGNTAEMVKKAIELDLLKEE